MARANGPHFYLVRSAFCLAPGLMLRAGDVLRCDPDREPRYTVVTAVDAPVDSQALFTAITSGALAAYVGESLLAASHPHAAPLPM